MSSNMSDEDRDIDVESDAEKRAHHNALERKRRDHIKESFHGLRDSVPSLQGDKASRAQILKHATDYIQFMSKKNNAHQMDIDDLKHQNVQLEQQVRQMEKAKVLGSFAAESSEKMLSNGTAGSYHEDSDSDSSEYEEDLQQSRRKKLKVTK